MSKRTKNKRSGRRPRAPYVNEIQVIGNPATMTGPPVMREARLEDCDDDCEICTELRRQILAGNPPQVLVFE